uniref:Uncharacterized protein n=1 Tax=Anguilla anguilla TaxID=7936 RepID=A0A0E9X9S7_ANGAN
MLSPEFIIFFFNSAIIHFEWILEKQLIISFRLQHVQLNGILFFDQCETKEDISSSILKQSSRCTIGMTAQSFYYLQCMSFPLYHTNSSGFLKCLP